MSSVTASFKWNLHETKLPFGRAGYSVTAIDENRMLVTGGYEEFSLTSNVELFDISDKSIVKLPNMATERCGHSSVVLNNFLYIIGGWSKKSVHRMDLSKINTSSTPSANINIWEIDAIPDFDILRHGAAAVVHDECIYLFGGCEGDYVHSSCLRYRPYSPANPNPDERWEPIVRMNTGRFAHVAVKAAGKIYVMGGSNGFGCVDSMEVFDPSACQFENGPCLPIPLSSFTAVSVENFIIVNGGISTNSKRNNSTFVYDINRRIWISFDSLSMNIPRVDYATTLLQNKKLIACGGIDDKYERLDTMEWLSTDKLLGCIRWDRREKFILVRCLVERGRASPVEITDSKKRKRNSENEKRECSCFRHLIQKTDNDVFRSVIKFL